MTHADGWWGTGTFEYDGFGNLGRRWLSETGVNPRRIWNFYDANNRLFVTDDSLPTASGGASWHSHSYDDRGNITRSGSSANNQHTMFMAYDMSDQMVGMSGHNLQEAPLTASYQYNGAGKRVYTNHNGRESYPMYDAGGALRAFYKVHDGELVEQIALQNGHPLAKWTGSTLTYLHVDHLGTPIRGTHGLGGTGLTPGAEVFQDFATPYGLNPTPQWHGNGGSGFDPATSQGSNCGVTGFTMHAKDCESGLTHMQARQYSPVSGRFLSIDPVTFMNETYPGQFNRYAYTWNDPINATDPNGEFLKIVKSVYNVGKRTYKNGGNLKGALKDEALSYVENGATLLSKDASLGDKAFAIFDLATGFGDEAKGAKRLLGGKCCFVAGTLVETEDGLRPIEKIELGDRVLARNPETGETAYKAVTDLTRLNERMIWEVSLSGENNASEFFETTDDHPWWIVDADGNGSWKTTAELSDGMIVTTADNQTMFITEVVQTNRVDATYNLTVADFETYFVGENKVLVHNCPTGSYTNTHASGKTYDGKCDPTRAAESGRRVGKENNDPVTSTETRTAGSDRESFKQESRSLDANGGPKSDNNYNKIESPGKKYRDEDGS